MKFDKRCTLAVVLAGFVAGVLSVGGGTLPGVVTASRYDDAANALYSVGNDISAAAAIDNNVIYDAAESVNLQSPASVLKDEVDILQLLNVTHKAPGVSLTEGPIKGFPAYKFRLPYGNVQLSNSTPITSVLSGEQGFTVVFIYRQQRKTLGTLLSVNPPGRLSPWFQVTSNLRTGQLILHYRITTDAKLHQVYWPMPQQHHKAWPLAAWTWLSVSADYNTSTLRLDAACLPSRYQSLVTHASDPLFHPRINVPQDALVYFRQEPGRKKRFLGSVQVAKVLPYVKRERLWRCDEILGDAHGKPKLLHY